MSTRFFFFYIFIYFERIEIYDFILVNVFLFTIHPFYNEENSVIFYSFCLLLILVFFFFVIQLKMNVDNCIFHWITNPFSRRSTVFTKHFGLFSVIYCCFMLRAN